MHTPVLLQEALEGLALRKDGLYIDATAGEGGHLKNMAEKSRKVLAIERNEEQFQRLRSTSLSDNTESVRGNFADIRTIAEKKGFVKVDGVLFDLGLSFWELAHLQKGFSFKKQEEHLDLRLDNEGETASDVLNRASEDELYQIFSENSEEILSREIAKKIVESRKKKRLETVKDLLDAIDEVQKDERVYARIFQALRMYVNSEKENLDKGVTGAIELLKKNGRLVVITFHSIEDRIVKKKLEIPYMKLIKKQKTSDQGPSYERSAMVRVYEKIQ